MNFALESHHDFHQITGPSWGSNIPCDHKWPTHGDRSDPWIEGRTWGDLPANVGCYTGWNPFVPKITVENLRGGENWAATFSNSLYLLHCGSCCWHLRSPYMLYEEMCLFVAFLLMALACAGLQVWSYTFPETNAAPYNALLVDYTYYTPFGKAYSQRLR